MKRLVGRPFNAPDVQAELSHLPFEAEALANGNVGIRVEYDNEPKLISAEHFLAMCLVKATQLVAYANNGASMGDCVMAVPASYNDAQRRAIMNACAIASVNCLKVTNKGLMAQILKKFIFNELNMATINKVTKLNLNAKGNYIGFIHGRSPCNLQSYRDLNLHLYSLFSTV